MESCENKIEIFFESNPEIISKYPGLNQPFLLDSFCQFFGVSPKDSLPKNSDLFFDKLKDGQPIQYILKNAFFYRSDFYVDERVLIPRSETEILVERASAFMNQLPKDQLRVAEVGVGSFCLGLSLLMESRKKVEFLGGDISSDALAVSKINLRKYENNLKNHKVSLVESDRLLQMEGPFDLIVSNPPYIKKCADRDGVHKQVLDFEPHLALFLEDEEFFYWFDEFFKQILKRLNEDGKAFIEGHEDNLEELAKLAKKYFNQVEIINDYTQRKRFLEFSK